MTNGNNDGYIHQYARRFGRSRAEGDRVVGRVGARAGPEGGAGGLIVRVDVRVGAGRLEVVVVRNAGVGALVGRRVVARAARGGVARVRVGQAVGLAADDGASGILDLEVGRACTKRECLWQRVSVR